MATISYYTYGPGYGPTSPTDPTPKKTSTTTTTNYTFTPSGSSSPSTYTPYSSLPISRQSAINYTIKPGDTLSGIAAKYGTTVSALTAANPSITNPNVIYAGNTIKIPTTTTSTYTPMTYTTTPFTTTPTTTTSGSFSSLPLTTTTTSSGSGGSSTPNYSNMSVAQIAAQIAAATGGTVVTGAGGVPQIS